MGLGRFGPYVVHEGIFASLTNVEELFSIGLNRAIDLIEEKKLNPGRGRVSKTIKEIGKHPEDKKDIILMEGRYGPFVKYGKINASVPKDINLDDVNLEMAVELIQNQKIKKEIMASPVKPKHAASLVITRQKKKFVCFDGAKT